MASLDILIPAKTSPRTQLRLRSQLSSILHPFRITYKLIKIDSPHQAFSRASAQYVALLDGRYSVELLPQMYNLALTHGLVVANRPQFHNSLLRRIINRLVFQTELDLHSGLKLFPRHFLSHLSSPSFDFPLLQVTRDLGFTPASVDLVQSSSPRSLRPSFFSRLFQFLSWRLGPDHIYSQAPADDSSPLGQGVIYRRRYFTTHTRLPRHLSAVTTFTRPQAVFLIAICGLILYGLSIQALLTAQIFIGFLSLVYFADVLFSLFLIGKSLQFPPEISVSDHELSALDPKQLPLYTILCPLYREAHVLPQFIEAISRLDWPTDKLEVILLLEEDDPNSLQAAQAMSLSSHFRILVVPHSLPKTKPKACNFGLAHAQGSFVVVYDAEDRPDPDQLKKAYLAFLRSSPQTACLQAKLNYYNPHHNLLTRLFTAEYSLWFDVVLPALQSINTTIPLGGTSNHFKTAVLKNLHGWDAFNVTEDCDLGTRLFHSGYKTAIIDSVTWEEANTQFGNWLRQRSRWIKGYLQTFLVHNRNPWRLLTRNGWHGLIFQLTVGGKIAFMLINPILWASTIGYFAFYRYLGPTIESLYPPLIFYLAGFSFVIGNFLYLYSYMIGCAKRGRWELIKYVYLIPFYWLLISLAAVKAVFQLIVRPHYWEKTHHSLHLLEFPPSVRRQLLSGLRNFLTDQFGRLGVLSKPLFTGAALLVAASMFSNFFNFLYNIYLGRYLPIEQFSLVGLLGSFVYLVQIPTSALSKTLSHRVAYLLGQKNPQTALFWNFVKNRVMYVFLAVTVVWVFISPGLSRVFQAQGDVIPFLLFAPLWLATAAVSVHRGLLAGHHRFAVLAAMIAAESLSKFILAVMFVNLGWLQFIYATLPLSLLPALIISFTAARGIRQIVPTPGDLSRPNFPFHFFSTSILIKLSSLAFLSLDVILAKIYLPPSVAGQYVLLSLAGKIVYFLGSLFDPFIIPIISRAEGEGANPRPVFYQLLLGNALTSLAGFIALGPAGHIFAPLLFGPKIIPVIPFLTWYSLAMVNFTLSGSIVNYHQARRQYIFPVLGFSIALLQPLLVFFFHESLADIIGVMLILSLAYLGSFLLLHFYYRFSWSVTNNLRDLWDLLAVRLFPRQASASPNSLRILIFNWRDTRHKWAGGAETYIHELAKRWVKSGHTVTVFCGNDGKSHRKETLDGVQIIRHGGFFTVYFWAAVYYLLRLRGRFDIVIDSENGIPFFTPLFVAVPKILLIHHIHQDVFRRQLFFPLAQIAMFLESRLMPLVYLNQKIITVSESSKTDIIRIGLGRPDDIEIVNPGVDHEQFTHRSPKTSQPSFVYVGRIRPYKNIDVAIRAFSPVAKKYPRSRLNIAGAGEGIKELRHLTQELNLTRHVYFFGRVSDRERTQLLSESWAMLQPSSFEGWGITVIEANACGTIAIASDVIGLRDSVRHNKTGVLVPPLDHIALSQAIEALIAHPSRLAQLSRSARSWSLNFNWVNQSHKFLTLLHSHLVQNHAYSPSSQPALAEQRV